MTDWTIDDSRHTYNVAHWGEDYFHIDASGRAVVRPRRDGREIVLGDLIAHLQSAGIQPPVLLRFLDILDDRVAAMLDAFAAARERHGYQGRYTAVYPIKVNQQRSVVERLRRPGDPDLGLEAGSKPELMAVMALSEPAAGPVICNGYKDTEYVRLALIGARLGLDIHIVVEQPSEVELIARLADEIGVEPTIGLRVRLAATGSSHWRNSGGDRSKFGLSAQQSLAVVDTLREWGCLHWLQLLHFHMGSQIANLRDIAAGITEAGRYYATLRGLGAPLTKVDVGGGLAVDYDGARSRAGFSMNYRLEQYAETIVEGLARICREQGLPEPAIVTEAGRAMTAHHAVLVTNVIDTEGTPTSKPQQPADHGPGPLHELWSLWQEPPTSPAERYQEALRAVDDAHGLYMQGRIDLAAWADVERLFVAVARDTHRQLERQPHRDPAVRTELQERLATKYFCNFSVFQSTPDVWAIDQHFPVMPLARLDERPTVDAILHDLTCDSDGQLKHYIHGDGVFGTLPLHPVAAEGPAYSLGIFLVGAYQEILGDRHNLFGDTHAVDVELSNESWRVLAPEYGDRVDELLRYVHFAPEDLLERFRARMEGSRIPDGERRALMAELEAGLSAYTYLRD